MGERDVAPNRKSAMPSAVVRLIEMAGDITGALASATIAFLEPSAVGILAGAATGPTIKHTLVALAGEVASRTLGRREQVRVGAVLTYAAAKIQENLAKGKRIRSDDFFTEKAGRSAADEIAEGVVLAAQRDHEEKKLRLYGNLLANLAFSSVFSRAHGNLLIRLAEQLSYRQLCLLALFSQDSAYRDRLPNADYRAPTGPQIGLLQETTNLSAVNCFYVRALTTIASFCS